MPSLGLDLVTVSYDCDSHIDGGPRPQDQTWIDLGHKKLGALHDRASKHEKQVVGTEKVKDLRPLTLSR